MIIEYQESGDSHPLQREQFETLYRRIQERNGRFELERIPADAEPYTAVLTLHPRFEIDEKAGVIIEIEKPSTTHVIDDEESTTEDRVEPDIGVYSDTLLLINSLERHDLTNLTELDTDALVNLYTLLSDVQRGANDFGKTSPIHSLIESITTSQFMLSMVPSNELRAGRSH